jgi:hypothetical protein
MIVGASLVSVTEDFSGAKFRQSGMLMHSGTDPT